jgi:hypothetical protein
MSGFSNCTQIGFTLGHGFGGFEVVVLPVVDFEELNEVNVVGPQLQVVVGFRVVCVTGGDLVGLGVSAGSAVGSIGGFTGPIFGSCCAS